MESEYSSREADSHQTRLIRPLTQQSIQPDDPEAGVRPDEASTLVDLALRLRLLIIVLAFVSIVLQLASGEIKATAIALACITVLTIIWNVCFTLLVTLFPRTWKQRSDNEEPQKPYRRLAPLNDAWLSGYIFMFTLWGKLRQDGEGNGNGRYNVDAVFILNCIVL